MGAMPALVRGESVKGWEGLHGGQPRGDQPFDPNATVQMPTGSEWARAGIPNEVPQQDRRQKLAALTMKYRGQLRPAGIGGAGARGLQNSPYGYIQQQTATSAGPPPWNPMKAHSMGYNQGGQ